MTTYSKHYMGIYCDTYAKAKKETIESVVEILIRSGAKYNSEIVKKVEGLNNEQFKKSKT